MSKRRTARGGGRGRAGGRATGRSAAAQKQFKASVKEARSKGIDTRGETRKKNEELENQKKEQEKQRGSKTANIKDDGILAGIGFKGQEVDPTVEKKDYKDPKKHKLRNQFDYLVDKYYGGTEQGAKEFAKTSQGQLLLGYLAGVSADRGGGRGGDRDALQRGAPELFQRTQTGLPSITVDPSFRSITPFDIRNLDITKVRQNFTDPKTGIEDTAAFNRFNQALQVAAPDAFAQARPFSSGQGIGTLIEQGAGFVPGLGMASRFIGNLLPQKATGGLSPDEYLDQSLFENLPTQTTDQGGMNDVAQFMIDNQAPIEEEEEDFDIAQFDPDSILPNFGIDVANLPITRGGGVTEVLPGFSLQDTIRLLGNKGIFSAV